MRLAILAVGLIAAMVVVLSGCGRTATPQHHEALVAPHDDAVWVAPRDSHSSSTALCTSNDCGPDAAALHWSIAPWGHTTTGYFVYVTNTTLGRQVADVTRSPWVIPGGDCGTTITLGVRAHDSATPTPDTSPLYSFSYTPACGGGAAGGPPGTQPVGDPQGKTWTLAFDDEFNGTSIDTTKWRVQPLNRDSDNAVESDPADCSEGPFGPNGEGVLRAEVTGTPGSYNGCEIDSAYKPYTGQPTGANAWELSVGDYVEFRVWFPGTNPLSAAGGPIANWSAVWARGTGPSTFEEYDVAEGAVKLTCNYHSPTVNANVCTPSPYDSWANSWHVYGVYRGATTMYFYWDGNLVGTEPESIPAADATPAALRFTSGVHPNQPGGIVTGPSGAMLVDWVRGYTPGR